MQIISKKCFHFKDATIEPVIRTGELVQKIHKSIIVQPSYRPQEIADCYADDPTFKNAVAAEDVEVL